jgi:hypothetical protein
MQDLLLPTVPMGLSDLTGCTVSSSSSISSHYQRHPPNWANSAGSTLLAHLEPYTATWTVWKRLRARSGSWADDYSLEYRYRYFPTARQ